MYHNHIDKDYSHPWYTKETLEQPQNWLGRIVHKMPVMRFLSPLFGWWVYLVGKPDGSHYIPFPHQRLWQESPVIERTKCVVSSAVVLAYFVGIYVLTGYDLTAMAYYYLAPLVVFGWWLFTVTYLQHHSPHTMVYDNKDWKFVDAAFETVDRKFGFGIDALCHHITDGHVAHHLFFTKIPHYNLPIATKAIKEYLAKNKVDSVYKYEDTFDFPARVHYYFVKYGFKATLFNEVKIADAAKNE
jgi:omega-3 fatty acid desaturase (delta-15 desaturase)